MKSKSHLVCRSESHDHRYHYGDHSDAGHSGGIKWIMGLLTPVGAMAIIDVVKFFIQRAAQIMELIKAFTDSVAAIASGKVGVVAKSKKLNIKNDYLLNLNYFFALV